MKIHPVGDDLFHSDGQTNRHDETKSFFEILRTHLKWCSCFATVNGPSVAAVLVMLWECQDSSSRIMAAVGLIALCQAVQKQVKLCRGMARSVTALGKFTN